MFSLELLFLVFFWLLRFFLQIPLFQLILYSGIAFPASFCSLSTFSSLFTSSFRRAAYETAELALYSQTLSVTIMNFKYIHHEIFVIDYDCSFKLTLNEVVWEGVRRRKGRKDNEGRLKQREKQGEREEGKTMQRMNSSGELFSLKYMLFRHSSNYTCFHMFGKCSGNVRNYRIWAECK